MTLGISIPDEKACSAFCFLPYQSKRYQGPYWFRAHSGNDKILLRKGRQTIFLKHNKDVSHFSFSSIFGNCWQKVNTIWWYDRENNDWKRFSRGAPSFLNDLKYLPNNEMFWIKMDKDCQWKIDGCLYKTQYCPKGCKKGKCL